MKLKKEDIVLAKRKANAKIASLMRTKAPRFSIATDRKKQATKMQCRGNYVW